MIQPAAPAPFPALIAISDMPAMPAVEGADGADFGALLAIQGTVQSAATAPDGPLPGAVLTALAAATPGKTLPFALPEAATAPPLVEAPTEQPLPATAALAARLAKVAAKPDTKLERTQTPERQDEAEPLLDQPASASAAAPIAELPMLAALPAVATAPTAALAPRISSPPAAPVADAKAKAEAKPEREHTGQGAAHRAIPALPAAASPQAQAQIQRRTAQAVISAAAAQTTKPALDTAQPAQSALPPTAVPAEQVQVELALPRLIGPGALNRDEARPLAKLPELVLPDAPGALTGSPAQPQPSAAPQSAAIAQVRPHDFAALIERIAVAREAAAPQAVSITVTHQDFGPVRLSFRPDDAGLSVALSSADPGFARAAAAIPVPVLPMTAADQAGFGQNQRSDSSPAQTGGHSQSRGGSGDPRRDGQPHSHPHAAHRSARERAAQRTGIFA